MEDLRLASSTGVSAQQPTTVKSLALRQQGGCLTCHRDVSILFTQAIFGRKGATSCPSHHTLNLCRVTKAVIEVQVIDEHRTILV